MTRTELAAHIELVAHIAQLIDTEEAAINRAFGKVEALHAVLAAVRNLEADPTPEGGEVEGGGSNAEG